MTGPRVAVIIPAFDAARTLPGTLASLRAQTCADWEAIVVDDGSGDATRACADTFRRLDPRVRVLTGPHGGAGAARNAGLAATRAGHVLFLDADDALEPAMLERALAALAADPAADAAHVRWWWTDARDAPLAEGGCEHEGDLFPLLARYCAITAGTCVVRRDLVMDVGGFDPALRTSEDFDLWQRVARAGARFVAVRSPLTRYRLRPDASWFDAERFLRDGLVVIARGHAPDPRVPRPAASHAAGAPPEELADARYRFAVWAAAIAAVRGGDAAALLDQVPSAPCPTLRAAELAPALALALVLVAVRPPTALAEVWAAAGERMRAFLAALEARSGAEGLAADVARELDALAGATPALGAPDPGSPAAAHDDTPPTGEPIAREPVA